MHASVDLSSAIRTRAAAVDFQILPQREDSSKLQKAHRKYAGVSDNRAQLPIRNSSGALKRARPGAEEHFVLDDVAHAGEDRLIQQDIGDFLTRKGTDLPKGRLGIPLARHDVGGEVVVAPRVRVFDKFQRGAPDGDFAVGEVQHQPGRAAPAIVTCDGHAFHRGGKRPPQHEVDAQRERVKLKNEMLAPGEDVLECLAAKSFDADPTVTADPSDSPAHKRPKLLGRKMD